MSKEGAKGLKIYLDVLIITNICLTAVFIECTARLTHIRLSRKRSVISSLIGGISALLAILQAESFAEGVILSVIKLLSVLIIVLIAFNAKKADELIKYSFLYICSNLLFAGLCMLLWRFGSSRIILINTLTVYLDISLIKLMTAATVTYIAMTAYEYIQRKSFSPSKRYHILLKIENLEYYLPAIADTGNSLTDVFTGKSVVIIACDELYYHFELDREEIALETGFHCVPYSTINGEGLINVTDNASVIIIDNNNKQKPIDCAVGIIACSGSSSRAIFSPSLIV